MTLKCESFDLPDAIVGREVDEAVDDWLVLDGEERAGDARLHSHRYVVAMETLEEGRQQLGSHDSYNREPGTVESCVSQLL